MANLFEGKTEDGNLLVGDCVEECFDNSLSKARPLVVIHLNHRHPVGGLLCQVEVLAQVNQIQDVLLEAGAAKTHPPKEASSALA